MLQVNLHRSTGDVLSRIFPNSTSPLAGCPLVSHAVWKSISTNTAINTALRRSRYHGEDSRQGSRVQDEREEIGGSVQRYSPSRRERRPNHQQRLDVDDMNASTVDKTRHNRSKISETSRNTQQRRDPGRSKSQYDYSPVPGGNRATRRAAQAAELLKSGRLPRWDAQHAADRHSAQSSPYTGDTFKQPQGFSMPEHLTDNTEELSTPPESPSFLIRKHYNKPPESENRHEGGSSKNDFYRDDNRQPLRRETDEPLSIPYTTPASEFLYGTSVVIAALLSSRRQLYKLYIYDGYNREDREKDEEIRRLALRNGVVAEKVKGHWLRLMDKMSGGRPHNVCYYHRLLGNVHSPYILGIHT